MEGVPPAPRRPRPNTPRTKKPKHGKHANHESKVKEDDKPAATKMEPKSMDEQMENVDSPTKAEPIVKEEAIGDDDSGGMAEMTDSFQASAFEIPPLCIVKKQEPTVKTEIYWDE